MGVLRNKSAQKQPVIGKVAKVPVIMQMETVECGAACLAMILAYYGKWVPLEQTRSACGVSRDGSTALNIVKAARAYGMEAKGRRCGIEELTQRTEHPSIICWNLMHYVVLCGFKGHYAYINDPQRGMLKVSMAEFDESYMGICLLFKPTDDFEPGGKRTSMWGYITDRLRGYRSEVVLTVLVTLIAALLGIITPTFNRVLLDSLLTGKDPDWLYPFTAALAAFTFIQLTVLIMQAVLGKRVNAKFAMIASAGYMWKVLHLPLEFFSMRMAGDIQQRRVSNSSIATTIVSLLAPLVVNLAAAVFYLVIMMRYSALLACIGFASVILNVCISRIISAKRVNITRVQQKDAGLFAATTSAGIEMIETIKSSGAENGYFADWAGLQASVNTQQVKYAQLNQNLGIVPSLVLAFTNALILTLSVLLTMQGQFTVGMTMAFQGLLTTFSAPVATLLLSDQAMQETRTQIERVEDVMQYPDDPYAPEADETREACTPGKKLAGDVRIRNLRFGYSRLEEPLIKDFSLDIEHGQSVAVVGASGCGKSTLSMLVACLYQPWEGEIIFDGMPRDRIDRATFIDSVAVVNQEIVLFEDTIANNIRLWDSSIDDDSVRAAAKAAAIHDEIMDLPGGYAHLLTEGGGNISGGQRQRIEIARAFAQNPSIIILDEATSALDAITEQEVMQAIRARNITCLIVAHRLSTIRACDKIVVLEAGEIVQCGTHESLYAQEGPYRDLVRNE